MTSGWDIEAVLWERTGHHASDVAMQFRTALRDGFYFGGFRAIARTSPRTIATKTGGEITRVPAEAAVAQARHACFGRGFVEEDET